MSYGKPARLLKTEAIITAIILVSAMVFSFEPTREFFMQSVIEQQYHDLQDFRKVSQWMQTKRLKQKDLKYVIKSLEPLNNPFSSFILKEDSQILTAKAYDRLGERKKAKEMLLAVLKTGDDPLAKMDAMLVLAGFYDEENSPFKAIQLIEDNKDINANYKRQEINFLLAKLYFQVDKVKTSGKYLMNTPVLYDEDLTFFCRDVLLNWSYYSSDEKKTILSSLSKMGAYETYMECASEYIRSSSPSNEDTEAISTDIVFNADTSIVKEYLNNLKPITAYSNVYNEMADVFTLSHDTVRSQSGLVRGYYYFKRLRPLARRARYNGEKAAVYYQDYLKGNIDITYVKKNLQLTIRNLLAYKKYEDITNVIEKSYQSLNLDTNTGSISDDISFWNAYSCFMLGDKDKALKNFESTISRVPDGYYAIQSKVFVDTILDGKKLSSSDYLNQIESDYKNSSDTRSKIYYGRLLFSLKSGSDKERLRFEIVALTERFNNSALFDFENKSLDKLQNNDCYVKFIAHTRFGMLDKAKAILTSADITDPTTQSILILKELVKNREFQSASDIYDTLANSDFIYENFAFMSKDLQMLLYPTPYDGEINQAINTLESSHLDPYLVYSIIRGESMYITDAHSRVGARGLMQLMPATARLISPKLLGQRDVNLYNTANNIILGTFFLNESIESYGFIPAIASYNGGIRILNLTKQKFYPENEIELMELIPYTETREYVKKIISNYYRYKTIYERRSWNALSSNPRKKNA